MAKRMSFGRNEVRQFSMILPVLAFFIVMLPFTMLMRIQAKEASLRDKSAYVTIGLLVLIAWQIGAILAWSITIPLRVCVPLGLAGAAIMAVGMLIDRRFLIVGNMYPYATKEFPEHLGIDWKGVGAILQSPFSLASVRLCLEHLREWRWTWAAPIAYYIVATLVIYATHPIIGTPAV